MSRVQWRTEAAAILAVALVCLTWTHRVLASDTPQRSDVSFSHEERQSSRKKAVSVQENAKITYKAALVVGVEPPLSAPRLVRRLFFKLEKVLVPLLYFFDPCKPPDSKLALRVLWWKALTSIDNPQSPVHDGLLALDLQPPLVQWLASSKWLRRLYPRFARAVVEIRTSYINQCITRLILAQRQQNPNTKIRLVCLGGGYDVRSIWLLEQNLINEAVELDRPIVITAKKKMLQRLYKRRPNLLLLRNEAIRFCPVDLNQVDQVRSILTGVLERGVAISPERWHTIFLLEGVLMYLDEGVPSMLLSTCRNVLDTTRQQTGSLCFADRLEKVANEATIISAQQELANHGWNLNNWLLKGGGTKHMGCASMIV